MRRELSPHHGIAAGPKGDVIVIREWWRTGIVHIDKLLIVTSI